MVLRGWASIFGYALQHLYCHSNCFGFRYSTIYHNTVDALLAVVKLIHNLWSCNHGAIVFLDSFTCPPPPSCILSHKRSRLQHQYKCLRALPL